MTKRRPMLVANWKMHGRLTSGLVLARDIAEKTQSCKPLTFDLVLCPPATLVWAINEAIIDTPVALGGQDCHAATHGAYTGDLAAAMFADLGCRYMILGHSERRQAHGETSESVAHKVQAAQVAGLTTIVCVGETAEEFKAGATAAVIERQVRESLPADVKMDQTVIAYEPVWAIGTGQVPSPDQIAAVHKVIRKTLGEAGEVVRVLYGGSVNGNNAGLMTQQPEIDGFLVGSASLNADGFWAIAETFI